ncbi:PREDICTED: AT-hook motif nuclear-localized protein 7-like [Tarenaya hassleriana]|uniref:AT-hook motif nuclear-localized protein 7-like n=1 Tax=Tarenaya hassleriana TaxID=28532 RepID=UPI0008FD4BC5|nr:PREDICTED: AT-hook motif nuclear-localized protein 7-like [Tarenaya hassleriana]
MEEKESTVSGSVSDSGSGSPSPVTSYSAAAAAVGETTPLNLPFSINTANINTTGSGLVTSFQGSMTSPVGPSTASPAMDVAAASGGDVMETAAVGRNGGGDLSGKKKRGRPRKYDSEGNLIIRSAPATAAGFSFSPAPAKKSKGKGFGSGNWNLLASFGEVFARTAGEDFTPHIITVNTGEDLAGKILSFTQKGPRGICVLSAIGAVSNVTIRQPGSAGGILTYEGRFEILTLTGSFVITEIGGVRNKTGGLSISLAGPDGRVIGGVVAGVLTASSPIQVVIGSFLTFGARPQKRKYERRTAVAPASSNAVSASTGKISDTKPENQPAFGLQQQQTQIPEASSFNPAWNGPEADPHRGISPDINVSAPSE